MMMMMVTMEEGLYDQRFGKLVQRDETSAWMGGWYRHSACCGDGKGWRATLKRNMRRWQPSEAQSGYYTRTRHHQAEVAESVYAHCIIRSVLFKQNLG